VAKNLGDENYRDRILSELDRLIEVHPHESKIVILAHSLGTVIAVDSLTNGRAWNQNHKITLITAGSPLKRMIWRFFPGVLAGDNAEECIQKMRSRIGSIAWINVYRPWDQVGSNLGLSRKSLGLDINTWQWWRLVSAHTSYWNDSKVLQSLSEVWKRVSHHSYETEKKYSLQKRYYYKRSDFDRLYSKFLKFTLIVIICYSIGVPLNAGLKQVSEESSIEALIDPNLENGVISYATVDYEARLSFNRGGAYPTPGFTIKWENNSYSTKGLINHRFSPVDFVRHIKCETRCRIEEIRIRYLPEKPTAFVLPDFPSMFPRIKYLVQIISEVFVWFVAVTIVAVLTSSLFTPYLYLIGAFRSRQGEFELF